MKQSFEAQVEEQVKIEFTDEEVIELETSLTRRRTEILGILENPKDPATQDPGIVKYYKRRVDIIHGLLEKLRAK